jgi:molybdopterin-guanine dinucleotide biosynthesis protein A
MGQDKRCLRLWGAHAPTLLAHTVALVATVCAEVVVVLNDSAAWPDLPGRLVPDAFPGAGPLGGLATGLAAVTTDAALLLACDMPLLQPALLRALLDAPLRVTRSFRAALVKQASRRAMLTTLSRCWPSTDVAVCPSSVRA